MTTDTDGAIRQRRVASHRQIGAFIPSHPMFEMEAISPGGTIIAATKFDGNARLSD